MHYSELVRTYPRYVAFGFLHTFFSSVGQTFLIALFMPSLREAFSQSAAQMGAYYGLVTIASAGLLFFTGPLIDRLNLRVYAVGVALTAALGCLLMAFSPHLIVMIFALFLIRHGGQGLMTHVSSTAMSRYFTLARGKALGIAGLGIAFGEATLPVLLALLLNVWSWRQVYLLQAAGCVLILIPLALLLVNKHDDIQHPQASQAITPEQQEREEHTPELGWDRGQVLRHPYFWMLLPLFLLPPFLGTGYFFFQTEIAAYKGWSKELFASCFFAYGVAAATTAFSIGPLIDRWGGKVMLPFSLLPLIPGLIAIIMLKSILGGYLFMIALGISFGTTANTRNAMWVEVFGRTHLGSIRSFATMLMVFSTALSPPLGGWLLERGVSMDQLLWGSVWLIVAGSVMAFVARPPQLTNTPTTT